MTETASTLADVEVWTVTATCGGCANSGKPGFTLWGGREFRECSKCKGSAAVTTNVTKLSPNVRGVLTAMGAMEMDERFGVSFTPNQIGYYMEVPLPRSGNHGTGNVARQMAVATRVTPALTGLRSRGLVTFGRRPDGRSGTAYQLTDAGREARDLILRWQAAA